MDPSLPLSPHFSLRELTVTEQRDPEILTAQGSPAPFILENLTVRLCPMLEAIREKMAGPVVVTSGFRCPKLNAAIGGSKTSAHMAGLAADLHVPGANLVDLFESIVALDLPDLDQLILEFGRWVHVGGCVATARPRHQLLMIWDAGKYLPFDPSDPRVHTLRGTA